MQEVSFQVMKLDEVCEIVRGQRAVSVEGGKVPVYGAGKKPTKFTDRANTQAGSIRVTSKATLGNVYLHSEPFWAEETCLVIKAKEDIILSMYLYHWLKSNRVLIQTLKRGETIPSLDLEKFRALPIEIPSLAYQYEVCFFLGQLAVEVADLILQADLERKRASATSEKFYEKLGGHHDI
ncbi:restriction endonuclease subunit S [Streptococcus cuniculipharyngis]|uniref:Restriction endonuclease subunit S n=1 Tax=Streptococcus cuniculipharyngis TaxID=1562651 RepID=A0A5C5SEE3_9STRE|nr:restriction endonuclease subunit S [Streptococcus cuniculipharyngis]TWS99169.1 restriction endonuclease subunit S [Streptococcus cuniculipharyngis]